MNSPTERDMNTPQHSYTCRFIRCGATALLLLGLAWLPRVSMAQTYEVEFTVVHDGAAVEGAKVVALHGGTSARVDSAYTDASGKAVLVLGITNVARDEEPGVPDGVEMSVYPNPAAAGQARARIVASAPRQADLVVYDVLGREVERTRAFLRAGVNEVAVPGTGGLAAGTYFVQLRLGGTVRTRPLVVVGGGGQAVGAASSVVARADASPATPAVAARAEYRFEVSAEGFDPYLSLPVDVARLDRRLLTVEVFEPFVNSIGMAFARIPAGTFLMGDIQGVGYGDELPVHEVTLTKDFYIGKYEVTQAQWQAVMGSNPSWFSSCGVDCPVEWVSWEEAQAFVEALNALEETTAYRLPTEAEWEYAARAGTTTSYAFGDDEDRLDDYAWARDNSGRRTQPVGQKKPNLWGLHDIHGNVFEWVQDWYKGDYYLHSPSVDPPGPDVGAERAMRGGSWYYNAYDLRVANRGRAAPDYRTNHIGLRLVRSVE
ncbi:hypothetical protein AWN76_007530 [Rhodothermaceae bacterium RA]|nr:hypothetical protein AWN76_007530 [Rhodothermaceae bacterium RA]